MYKNIKFRYLYRDGNNNKKYASLIFKNTQGSSMESLQARLLASFWGNCYFVAHQIRLPELFFEDFPESSDISFHEYDEIEETDESSNDPLNRSIEDFVFEVTAESAKGWKVFDPFERLFAANTSLF